MDDKVAPDSWLHRWLDTARARELPRIAVWHGALKFPKGQLAAFRADSAELSGSPIAVAAVLDRFAADVHSGARFIDVLADGDTLTIVGVDWREDHDRVSYRLGALFDVAARHGAKGKANGLGELGRSVRDGKPTIWSADESITWNVKPEACETTERSRRVAEPKVLAALAAVSARFEAWLGAHADARDRMEHRQYYGYLDREGRVVIPPTLSWRMDMHDDLAALGGTVIDRTGRVVGTWPGAGTFRRGLMPVKAGASPEAAWGYADRDGVLKIPPQFIEAESFDGPLAVVRIGPRFAPVRRWLDTTGALVGEPFDYTSGFAEHLAWVYLAKTREFRAVDPTGAFAFEARFASTAPYAGGLAAASRPEAPTTFGYVDRRGSWVIEPAFAQAHAFSEDRAVALRDGTCALIDRAGAPLGERFERPLHVMSGGLIAVRASGKVGFLDGAGRWAIEPRFAEAYGFFEELAYATLDGRTWGHVDRTGTWVIEPTLEWTNRFEGGLAPAKHDGAYGFIDRAGRWIIEPRWKSIQPRFTSGLVWAQLP